MVVAIRDGHCASFAEAVQLWPICAFKHHRAVKTLLLETQIKARRIEEISGKQQFQTLTENWHGKNGRERQVYTTITDFLNQKFEYFTDLCVENILFISTYLFFYSKKKKIYPELKCVIGTFTDWRVKNHFSFFKDLL